MTGNGDKEKIHIENVKKTLEERQEISLANKRGQFILLKLIQALGIKPLKKDKVSLPRWVTINLDGLDYDFTEICEKALDDIEIFRREKTKK